MRFLAYPPRILIWPRATNGTKVRTDLAFAQQGDRFPVTRVIDGKYGTQRWQASYNKQKKQNPWLEFTFEKPVKVGRLRMSSNREYYYETDYLEQKNKFNFDKFLVNVKVGRWNLEGDRIHSRN